MEDQNQQNQQAQSQQAQAPPPQNSQNLQRQQAAERVKQANNILVTVSNNPSVDQLAACIGLTLALNRLNKHATAVFSGQIPNTIEFLQPEKTIEKNTDSLRDFIIALDKAKADKLRYKVEDNVVKIFITPYRTSISQKDLQFSQGDFNVDVVVALGVHNQRELDQAITSHGRILHDASVITMNIKPGGELGAINWMDQRASSLSELVVQLIDAIDKRIIDAQLSTALLTGIVAETQRFSNKKTSALTMSYSAELMAAGANQQLVATKLEPPKPPPPPPPPPPKSQPAAPPPQPQQPPTPPPQPKPNNEGMLEIQHDEDKQKPQAGQEEAQQPFATPIDIDQEGTLRRLDEQQQALEQQQNSQQQQAQPAQPGTNGSDTLKELEEEVGSPHLKQYGESGEAQPSPKPEQPDQSGDSSQSEQSSQSEDSKPSTDPTSHMASEHHIIQPPSGAQNSGGAGDGTVDPLSAPKTPLLHRESNDQTGQQQPQQDDQNQDDQDSQQNGGTTLPPPAPPPMMPNQ